MRRFDALKVPLDAVSLVEASAGTGKTYAITTLVLRLLLERGLSIDRILVVTFTEAATAELRGRVRARLREALNAFNRNETNGEIGQLVQASPDPARDRLRLSLALQHVDEAPIHTIHGFCHRVLGDSAFESGVQFDAELLNDDKPLRDDVLLDYWTSSLVGANNAEVRAVRQAGLSPATCRGLADAVLRAPYMPVLPPLAEQPREPDREGLERAFGAMRDVWDAPRALELLSSSALNKNLYREGSIAGWVDTMSAFLSSPSPEAPRTHDWLVKMSTRKLAASCKQARKGEHPTHPFFDATDVYTSEVLLFEAWAAERALWFKRRLVDYVRVQMPRRKEQLGVMSFDDLLLRVDDALAGPFGERLINSVRARYPVALIDEFQDTDPVQWAIFERIWRAGTMFLIGDPKQAIYAFRGADVFAYMAAAESMSEERRYTMAVNWRSDPKLVHALGSMFGRLARPFLMESIGFPAVHAREGATNVFDKPLTIAFVPREPGKKSLPSGALQRVPHAVAADISALLMSDEQIDGRPIGAGDIAILTRTNVQAFEAQRALRLLGVRSVVMGDQSVFEPNLSEAREIALVLAAVAEPTSSGAVRAALTTELFGITASKLAAMDADVEDVGEGSWSWWIDGFRELNTLWSQRGFVRMFRALMSMGGIEQRLLMLDDGERRVTNVLHLMELLHTAASTLHLGPAGLIQWLSLQRSPENARARPENAQIRLESDEHAVKITTIHRSKGLEYPVVYCPHLWDGTLLFSDEKRSLLFHDPDDGNVAKLDLAPEDGGASVLRGEWEKLAENIRLLYVALTRAKHRCTLVWGAFRKHNTSSLGYVLHEPPLVAEGAEPTVAGVKAHLSGLSDERLLADLGALDDAIAVKTLDLDAAGLPFVVKATEQPELKERRVRTPVNRWWRTASFSEMSSGRGSSMSHAEGRDRDEHTVALPRDPDHAQPETSRPVTLLPFPRGPKAGNFFHALLEDLDFKVDERADLIRDTLAAHGYGVDHAPLIETALTEILDTALPVVRARRRFTLRHLAREHRVDELEFYLPVGSASKTTIVPKGTQLSLLFQGTTSEAQGAVVPLGRLTSRKLASVFSDHPSDGLLPSYAERVAGLNFIPLEGYLKGFIDLIYVHDERWYLVDYKTNHLGDDVGDYAAERLPHAMAHGHYYLQYHLYAVALHRYLKRRLKGYDYTRHFGGVQYLFVKGMTPETGSACGIFAERPPLARIDALGELLDRPPLERGDP